jgi:NADH-quinone oxidoreductase subunit G
VLANAMASKQLFDAVPFYAGLTLDDIGGRGVRWPELNAEWNGARGPGRLSVPTAGGPPQDGALRLGTYRSLWAAKDVDVSPALHFVRARQIVEMSPEDADALGIGDGEQVEVGANGTRIRGTAKLRAAVPPGSVFVAEGVTEEPGNRLTEPFVQVERMRERTPA